MILTTIDIETRPAAAYTWGLFKANIGISQITEPGGTICFAAKTFGKRNVEFYSTFHDGHEEMVRQAHRIIDESDAIIHYNGARFDTPHLQKEMALLGLTPPSPVMEIDLLRTVRRKFRFESNKLDFVSQQFGIGHKVKHEGFELWLKCMADDPDAWGRMMRYCKADVVLTEKLYRRILPWIDNHPVISLYDGSGNEVISCPNCASRDVQRRGMGYTRLGAYHRYLCKKCGRWFRGGTRVGTVIGR